MNAIKYADILTLVRSIQRELRRSIVVPNKGDKSASKLAPSTPRVQEDASVRHMMNVMRENQVTERRFCRPQDHYRYFAETYLTYLRSSRLQAELTNKYFNRGDKSVEDSARLVGLELPRMPKVDDKRP